MPDRRPYTVVSMPAGTLELLYIRAARRNVMLGVVPAQRSVGGPWDQGRGPVADGIEWDYVEKPAARWLGSTLRENIVSPPIPRAPRP